MALRARTCAEPTTTRASGRASHLGRVAQPPATSAGSMAHEAHDRASPAQGVGLAAPGGTRPTCVVHEQDIDPFVPLRADIPGTDMYFLVAAHARTLSAHEAVPCPAGDKRKFTSMSGDDHKNAVVVRVSKCVKGPAAGKSGGGGGPVPPARHKPYFAAVCLPLLFGISRALLEFFVEWHFAIGFEQVFAYAKDRADTLDVPGGSLCDCPCSSVGPWQAASFCIWR